AIGAPGILLAANAQASPDFPAARPARCAAAPVIVPGCSSLRRAVGPLDEESPTIAAPPHNGRRAARGPTIRRPPEMASPMSGTAARGRNARRDDGTMRPIAAALNLDARHVDVINRSHERCAALGLSRIERPDLGLLGRADLEIARSRNLRLLQHAAPVMELLYDQIVNTHSMVVLTDATGTIVH